MMAPVRAADVAAMIDHTLLRPEATAEDVVATCREAIGLGCLAVCISPRWVAAADAARRDSGAARRGLLVATVVGFPSGAHRPEAKAAEAGAAVADGADELDVVVSLGDVAARDWASVGADIGAVRAAIPAAVPLKVILESALHDAATLAELCRVVVDAGADQVKTSTGFHPAGGATTDAVARMRAAVGDRIGVKASGGIRDASTARRMIDAGASRIGASASAEILAGWSLLR